MSISATNRHFLKTVLAYSFFTVFCIVINKVYALFSHGVSSNYMIYMFLYPLIGCIIVIVPFWIFVPQIKLIKGYRIFYNTYNSGIACLTLGSCLKGIVYIAGTTTPFTYVFFIAGAFFIALAIIVLVISLLKIRCKNDS